MRCKKRQSTDDLKELEDKEILERVGTTGKGTYYILKGHQRGERGNKGAKRLVRMVFGWHLLGDFGG